MLWLMIGIPKTRGLQGFIDHLKAQPYYFSGYYHPRVSNVVGMSLLADAEWLHAAEGISFDGMLKRESGRPWKQFEMLMPWSRMTFDFAAASLSVDGREVADGLVYFFAGGAHVDLQGPGFGLSAQLRFEDDNTLLLEGLFKDEASAYGVSLRGGISRPALEPSGQVVSLRKGRD